MTPFSTTRSIVDSAETAAVGSPSQAIKSALRPGLTAQVSRSGHAVLEAEAEILGCGVVQLQDIAEARVSEGRDGQMDVRIDQARQEGPAPEVDDAIGGIASRGC